jgi:hypothetical protein
MLETTDNGADFSFQDRVFLCLALPDYRDFPAACEAWHRPFGRFGAMKQFSEAYCAPNGDSKADFCRCIGNCRDLDLFGKRDSPEDLSSSRLFPA